MCWITSIDGESRLSTIPFADITHIGTFYKSIGWRAKPGLTKLALQCGDLSFASKYFKCCYTLLDLHTGIVPYWKFAADSLKTFIPNLPYPTTRFFTPFLESILDHPEPATKYYKLANFFPYSVLPPTPTPLTRNHNIVQKKAKTSVFGPKKNTYFLAEFFLRVFLPP